MLFSLHGIKLSHKKATAGMKAVKMPTPATVTIPLKMHIGTDAVPVVSIGDKVYVGTVIANSNEGISAPIHSSVSGNVEDIVDITIAGSTKCKAVVIASDGENELDPNITPPVINSKDSLITAIKASGIVGLGGAGFPTGIKFDVNNQKIDELIINGAECEPFITSDNRTMIDRVDDMDLAIKTIVKYLGIGKIIIGIEKNKPEAIRSMKQLASKFESVEVKVLPSIYPQGGEKVIIYHTTGKTVPVGKLPINVGCIVSNCTTIADIGKFIKTGIPLVEKCITVDGSAVAEPKNVIAPIGSSLTDVFGFAGGFKSEPAKFIYGGPMMGVEAESDSAPVLKNTNAILAFDQKDSIKKDPSPCIKCGKCANVCPFGINPAALSKAFEKKDINAMFELGGEACMNCGCCSYVCPANRPLAQNNVQVKNILSRVRATQQKRMANKNGK